MKFKHTIAVLAICLGLSACMNPKEIAYPPGFDEIRAGEQNMEGLQEKRRSDFAHRSAVKISSDTYIAGDVMPFMNEAKLPEHFDTQVVLIEPPLALHRLAEKITNATGTLIQISPGLDSFIKKEQKNTNGSRTQEVNDKLAVRYEGRLSGLLDILAAHFGFFWEFNKGAIELYRMKTETFTLVALPGNVESEDRISNETDDDSSSSMGGMETSGSGRVETGQTTKISQKFVVWEEIIGNVRSMISEDGSAVANPTAGTISVTDSPMVLARVNSYIEQINKKLARQVSISVKVYTFQSEDFANAGVNLDPVFQDLENSFRATVTSANPIAMESGSGNLLATILDTTSDAHPGWGSQWEGSSLLLQALKRHGKVDLLTSGSGITMNNQPLPIQNISRIGYLKSVSITNTTDVGSETALEAGEVAAGFSMVAVPHILDNNKVALQYSIALSSLDSLNMVESGGSMIQTPEVSTRAFMQRVGMRLGQTLVLAGFEQERNENQKGRGLFGFMSKGSKERTAIVVVITVNDVSGA